jgi:hypothetical protein
MVKSAKMDIYDVFPMIWSGAKRNNFQSYEEWDINMILELKLGKSGAVLKMSNIKSPISMC